MNPTGKGGFKKGQSGNAGGRPKQLKEVMELAANWTNDSIAELGRLLLNGTPDSVRVRCAELLLNRAWGQPVQAVAMGGSPHSEALIEFLKSIDGESRRLPPGNDPDADREYDAAQAQRAQGGEPADYSQ